MEYKSTTHRTVESTVKQTTKFSISTAGIADPELKRLVDLHLATETVQRWVREQMPKLKERVGYVEVFASKKQVATNFEVLEDGIAHFMTSESDPGSLAWALLVELAGVAGGNENRAIDYAIETGLPARAFSSLDIVDENDALTRFNLGLDKEGENPLLVDSFAAFNAAHDKSRNQRSLD